MPPNTKKEAETADIHSVDIEQDKEMKKQLLIHIIASYCNESSEFEDFRLISRALKRGDKLHAEVISGGATNYSYKVYLEKSLDTALFAKIAFPYALWNPDRSAHYDVARATNEFKIMKHVKEMMGDKAPIATPYICVDVDEMKVVVTQWASADEQWANQFIDGKVDMRVVPKLAEALATLNLAAFDSDFDSEFNDNVRPCMRSVFPVSKALFRQHTEGDETIDSCVAYMKEMNTEKYYVLIDNLDKTYMTRECINHSDSHVFNLLVERKPSVDKMQQFGDKGDLIICDWEMAMAGPYGRDVGLFQAWPISCALFHAAHGHKQAAYDILDCCIQLWNEYVRFFVDMDGKDEAFMVKMFRTSMGFHAKYQFIGYYQLGILTEHFPTDGLREDMVVKAKGSVGLTGLKIMEYGFGNKEPDLSLDDLRIRYHQIVATEIENLAEAASKYLAHPRRESVLRETERRVSDAFLIEQVTRRLSNVSVGGRPSIYNDPAIRDVLDEIKEL